MVRLLVALSQVLRGAAGLLLVVMGSIVAWLGYERFYAPSYLLEEKAREAAELRDALSGQRAMVEQLQAQQQRLHEELAALRKENARLELAVRLLKVDRRVAQIDGVRQWRDPATEKLRTSFRFVELSPQAEPLFQPRQFEIEGDLVFVDYRIVKFQDQYVEQGDPLRSASIALLHRIFGEFQKPSEGFVLDEEGSQPAAYASGRNLSDFERAIWANFWALALNPRHAAEAGVRSAHGEAPNIRLVPGKRYRLILRSSGGLSFEVEESPGPAETL